MKRGRNDSPKLSSKFNTSTMVCTCVWLKLQGAYNLHRKAASKSAFLTVSQMLPYTISNTKNTYKYCILNYAIEEANAPEDEKMWAGSQTTKRQGQPCELRSSDPKPSTFATNSYY